MELTEGVGGFLRLVAQNYLPQRDDVVVPAVVARDYGLRDGAEVAGLARDGGGGRRVLVEVQNVGGMKPEEFRALIANEVRDWKSIAQKANIKAAE